MDPSLIGNAVELGVGLVKGVVGIGQNAKANKLEKQLVTPHYDIQQPIKDNQALAERDASQGMSDAARTAYQNSADRGLTTSIDALVRSGASVNSFSALYDSYGDDVAKMAMLEDELRMKHANVYMAQNSAMNDELDKQWQINVWKPYEDKKARIAQLRGAASRNVSGAIDGIGSAAAHFATGQLYKGDGTLKGDQSADTHFNARPDRYVQPGTTMGVPDFDAERTNIFSNIAMKPGFNLFSK